MTKNEAKYDLERKKIAQRDALVRFLTDDHVQVDTLRFGRYELTLNKKTGTFVVTEGFGS